MSKTNKPLGRKDEIVIQEIDGEVLIYDLRNDKAFCLNATSAAIWKLCDGDKSVSEISDQVAKEFMASNSEDLVWLALDQLKKEKLIDGGLDAGYDHFDGMSRRQVIRKIGLGSMIAIPLVASLVAPTSVHATSANCMGGGSPTGSLCNCPNPTPPTGTCTAPGTYDPAPGTPASGSGCPNGPGPGSCDCGGPFGANGSGGGPAGAPGFKNGTCR